MKKFLSILCVVAMAAALSMTAFAQGKATPGEIPENATPGEVVESYADQLLADSTNTALAKQINDMINANSAITVSRKTVNAMVLSILNGGNITMYDNEHLTGARVSDKDPAAKDMKLVVEKTNWQVEDQRYTISLHFEDANGNEVQPMLGAQILISVNGYNAPIEDPILVDENNRIIDGAGSTAVGDFTTFSFWAPHFSTYTIMPRSEYKPNVPPTTEPTTPPTTEPTTPPTTAPSGGDDQPIKATGADMSLAVFAVLALAGVVIGGGALAARKNG